MPRLRRKAEKSQKIYFLIEKQNNREKKMSRQKRKAKAAGLKVDWYPPPKKETVRNKLVFGAEKSSATSHN